MLSAALMSVAPAFMAKPMSTWHSRHVYLARCSQCSNTTGASPAASEWFLMRTVPYSYGSGRRFLPDASARAAEGRASASNRRMASRLIASPRSLDGGAILSPTVEWSRKGALPLDAGQESLAAGDEPPPYCGCRAGACPPPPPCD